ncbi:hypothetical protein Sden_3400 [Shewanella denitrificans OS217]|uniref:Uncharacterized protein n=1 Tax=Shewanella denitrificans (strain OS217 / ATCC BAA-1090 / DSM 15013) TaxID=318161 RepID=Q12IQ0_SHEDO|nr:hypothetical protein [Shewanella denitrificans]ABE56676.1 hypothetical protein Sden_3400 [Shewanella denitrificans OS217]
MLTKNSIKDTILFYNRDIQLNKLFIALLTLCLMACDNRPAPSFYDVEKNFYDNKIIFNELAATFCDLGLKKNFGNNNHWFGYNIDTVEDKLRDKNLDRLLKKIGAKLITYQETESNQCSLIIDYSTRGFAGTGISYLYSYQVEHPMPFNSKEHTFEKISNLGLDMSFDKALESGWYFSFKYT